MRCSLLSLTALIVLATATAAAASPPPGSMMMMKPGPQKAPPPNILCAQMAVSQATSIDAVGARLNLTPKQRPVFAAWRKIKLENFRTFPCEIFALARGNGPQTVVERLTRQEKLMTFSLGALRAELPSLAALYKVLTPEQRLVLDQPLSQGNPARPNKAPMTH